jgi:hypothetical protein
LLRTDRQKFLGIEIDLDPAAVEITGDMKAGRAIAAHGIEGWRIMSRIRSLFWDRDSIANTPRFMENLLCFDPLGKPRLDREVRKAGRIDGDF